MAIKKGFGSSSIANIANGNMLDDFLPESNKNTNNPPTDRGWLPAPYNIITEPVNAGGNTTNYGNNYAASKKAFDERVARIDQTEEAANLRQAWATPPRVSIENGRIKLTGSTQFLASDTAQQLRNIFKEMEGQTYNTEALNQQIEAWNVDLQKMAEDNMSNLDTLNEMNYSISQTATGPNPHMLTYEDLLRIGNNVAVGRQEDAINSDKLIFVGYEWDDEGNQIPKYMTAKEFAEEFNSTPDPVGHAENLAEAWENRSADTLISGKRRAWSQLNAQAAEGDPGAIAKLMYLQGGSEGGPANVVMSGTERFNDFVFTASINAMNGLTSGLDFATKWYNAAFGNILGLPRLIGNISNVVGNGWDWNKFWESDVVDKQVEEMNDAVSWANSYFSAVTPGSTMLGATIGGIEGAVASIAFNVVSANIGQELAAQVVNKGLTTAGNALELSGQGIRISATIEGAAGKLQGVTSMNGSMVTGTGYTIANATRGTAELSVVLPKFLVEKFPGIARAITESAFSIQAASQGAQLAGMAGSDIGVLVTNTNPAFKSLFNNGAQSLALITQGAKTVGNKFMLGKQALDSMRNWSTGIRLGLNLYMAGNYNTIRHIDRYLRDQYNGKDDGDMASYVAINTARDVAIAAALGIGGATINHFRQISRMSKIAPTRVVDAVQIGVDNSANGFYTSSTSAQSTAQAKTEPTQETHAEVTNLFNSSMTANGERFFVPNDATQATVVPGSSSVAGPQGVATATGIIKDNKLIRSRIVPAVGGFNVVSSARDLATGEETTDVTFHLDFDSANNELQKSTVPIVNPKTLGNSDLAVSANVAPLSVDGLSAIRHLPDGTSRLRISNDILYLKPEEFEQKVSDIVAQMSPEIVVEFTNSVRSVDLDGLAARIYGEGPELPAPQLRIPKNPEEAKAFARDVATARAVSQYNGDRGVVIPTRIDANTVDIVRRRRMVTERVFYGGQPSEASSTEGGLRGQDAAFVENIDNSSLSDKMKEQIINNVEKYYTSPKKVDGVELSYLDWTSLKLYQMSPSEYTNRARELLDKDEHDYSDVIELRTRSLVGTINKHKQERPRLYRIEGINGQTYTAGDTVALPLASFSKSTDIFTKSGRYLTTKMYTPGDEYYIIEIEPGKYGSLDISDIAVKPEQQEVLVSDSFTVKSIEEMDTPPGDIKSSKCYKVVLTPTDVDAGVEQVGARLSSPYAGEDNVLFDEYGVKVKRVTIGDQDVQIDYEIADRIAELNEKGFRTYNSHSGIAADHESPGDAGGGYIQFNGAIDNEKLSAIKKAADAADMVAYEEYNTFYGPVMLVYQEKFKDGRSLRDIIRQANINTAKHYGLPLKSVFVRVANETPDNKNWLTLLEEQGKFNEGLDYRDDERKRLEKEAGGHLQDTDELRKNAWDKFFSELGVKKAPNGTSIEMTKARKTIDVETRTPRKYVVTENGLTKGSFSDIQEALDYKAQGDRQIYELDPNTPVMDRPPVTTDSLYNPAVRSESAAGKMSEDTTYEAPKFDASGHIERFNGLMASMPLLRESPTDYTQGIVDIAREVQSVYNGLAETVDMSGLYEDYARQIAEGVEQPTVSPELREALAPLSSILSALGHYFDPSGSSLTQDFYLPTGAPSKKLASVEDALLHPDRAVDVDNPATVTFDEILVDPMRIGDSGFWEKRSGELFRDEDGNFTMAKAGTLEENLIAYTVAALTRGQNALLVAANDEVAFAKFDRNRNQISTTEALKGLKGADKNRQKIRAAQIKNARGYDKKLKSEKINKLEGNYDDKSVIDAIEEAYAAKDFAKDINYTRNVAENSRILGYRRTLTINNIKGSALRFGSNNGFRGISNDIRKASYIKVTGTKWVTRYGEKRCVAFGLTDAQMAETEATVSEPAVNLGDSAMMLFAPDRAAGAFYRTILDQSEQWATQGGWSLLNSIKDFSRENFPLLSNPDRAAEKLFQQLTRNFDAYSDPTALYLANQETISTWIKRMAATHINSAIQMADVDAMDDRTIDAIDQIMTKALVGSAVYSSKIVSALQRATYASTLWFNPSPMIGNLLSEPARGIDFFGYKVFAKAMKQFISPKARAIAKTELGDMDTYLNNDPELVGLAAQVKSKLARAFDSFENKAMSLLQKSEEQKNLLFWMMAKENAKLMYPKDPSAQLQNALRTFNDVAIAGGAGTTPGVASSNLGRMAFVLKTFSLRNWDDFIEMTKQIGYGRSGSYRWDRTRRGRDTGGQGGYSSTAGKNFDYKKAGRFVGGTLLRRYLLWLFVLGPLGRSILDALGGDPTGLTDNYSRGLYDDEGTDEYEGMTPLDNIINHIPTGFIFGTLKDFYFAARRAGVETGDFLGPIDIERDARLQKDLKQHLPLGVMTRRIGDMLELMDRGYSFNSNDNKTYAAPQTLHDTLLGFTLGKSATSNAQAYNKYRYGAVNVWGDIFEGDWLDFAMSANPLAGDLNMVKFDTTRTNYSGVFHGSYNDVPVMQAAVADLRERRATIIRGYNEDLEKFTGEFEGLTDEQRKAKAAERREAKIQTFTEDVQRLVDEYQKVGNTLSDKQINTLMYLFDFNEGDDDTYDSQIARERYVRAELPDVSTNIVPKQDKDTGEVTEPNYFQRSLVYQNAVQGRYGIPREAAKAVDSALTDFKNVYKEYKKRVGELNDKAYSATKGSADRKKYQAEVEKVQEEYLNQLYTALTPVVQQYGTEVLSSNDVIESLQPYMSSMVPYSSIKKYGLQYNSGNDIVWGQLSDWVKNRWGATAPTAGSDPEITNGIKEIKSLKNQGKISQAKSQARLLLERIARGSLSARNNDVIELRSLLYD